MAKRLRRSTAASKPVRLLNDFWRSSARRRVQFPSSGKIDTGQTFNGDPFANLGNQLRHAYHRVDHEALWNTYENDLDPLQLALEAILASENSKEL
jgi:hypothetical protein